MCVICGTYLGGTINRNNGGYTDKRRVIQGIAVGYEMICKIIFKANFVSIFYGEGQSWNIHLYISNPNLIILFNMSRIYGFGNKHRLNIEY